MGEMMEYQEGLDKVEVLEDLSMIVYLRGDENFFNEFSLSADDVMKRLCIKRSRLNQISGRELRVGRTRIDRYIRPVYRPKDIEAYEAWTRATATHKSSSQVIEQARDRLTSQADKLVSEFTKEGYKIQAFIKKNFVQKEIDNYKTRSKFWNRIERGINNLVTPFFKKTTLLQNKSIDLLVSIKNSVEELSKTTRELKALPSLMLKLDSNVQVQRKMIEALLKEQVVYEKRTNTLTDLIVSLDKKNEKDFDMIMESLKKDRIYQGKISNLFCVSRLDKKRLNSSFCRRTLIRDNKLIKTLVSYKETSCLSIKESYNRADF